ncbi:MAG TPA: biopolymer transporter Tol [Lentisphaeria bacterium]|nr:MAG: hypothetical protein A2X48_16905 [Lentisphaerae bacterium GWF2_49_21]HBC88395.1 biopolymer transporter Tol [Lentisphaeria bacterium]
MEQEKEQFSQCLAGVKISQVLPGTECHTIHTYFNISPESPDGRHVLYFASSTPEGHLGEVRIIERATGREKTLARNITTEDAHRVACQQWSNGGKDVVYHDFRKGRWTVLSVDIGTLNETVLAEDRQLGFGSAKDKWIPLYGCHWNPGPHRNLEMVNVETQEIRTPLKIEQVCAEYPDWIRKEFGDGKVSIFFPILSPDGKKAMFKMACGGGGNDFRSPKASHRNGKIIFDMESSRLIRQYDTWGHPSWHPDSRRIFGVFPDPGTNENRNILLDPQTGEDIEVQPSSPSDHPSYSPDGRYFVTDANIFWRPYGKPGENAIFMASTSGNEYVMIDRFINTKGAKSWRRPDPHPVFSPDSRRIYYNVSADKWTRLYVAEIPK